VENFKIYDSAEVKLKRNEFQLSRAEQSIMKISIDPEAQGFKKAPPGH